MWKTVREVVFRFSYCRPQYEKRTNGIYTDPLATPKPLNRSSQNVALVIMSWISTDVQNSVTIPQGVSFPRMREIAHQNIYSASICRVLPTAYSLDA